MVQYKTARIPFGSSFCGLQEMDLTGDIALVLSSPEEAGGMDGGAVCFLMTKLFKVKTSICSNKSVTNPYISTG